MKKWNISPFRLVLVCGLCVLAGAVLAMAVLRAAIGTDGIALLQAQALIRTRFVGDYDPKREREAAMDAMVDALGDRWSYYLTPEEYRETVTTRSNRYVGIGVTIGDGEGEPGLPILTVTRGSPAQKAGIQPGEVILSVDGIPITEKNREASIDRIRGEEGTEVRLEIQGKQGAVRALGVTRRSIQAVSAEWTMLEDGVALLRLSNFYTGAFEQVRLAVNQLTAQNARALVIDLRFNPGGYVDQLTQILDLLLPEGEIFRIRNYTGREKVYTSDDVRSVSLPMAVLVNENSFSAAELMAAQLRESAGASVVGTRTTGKGYAQNLYRLRDGSALNLSNSRYFTGGGVSLIGTGLTPDPYVGLSYRKQAELYAGVLDPAEDGQLQAALGTLPAS